MLEKWKQRAIQMNFKKAVLVFLAVSFVLIFGFSVVLYGNFKDRTDQWEAAVKTSREYQDREKGDEQDDRNDIALIAGCGIIGAVLYFYAVWKGTCDQCGRIRPDGSKYCDRCGKQFAKECPDCGQTVDIMADYCGNCGKKLSEKEDV